MGAELCVVNADGLVFQYLEIKALASIVQECPVASGLMWWAKFVEVLINEFQADQFQCFDPFDLKKFTYNKASWVAFDPLVPGTWDFMCMRLKCILYKLVHTILVSEIALRWMPRVFTDVNIGLCDGLVLSGDKLLPKSVLTQIYDTMWHQNIGHNEF